MGRMKKNFKCGHRGFGKYCHLCEQIKKGELIKVEKKYVRMVDEAPKVTSAEKLLETPVVEKKEIDMKHKKYTDSKTGEERWKE